jgi:hypothetical protein|tara:strand:- start:1546 stop:2376 length:831 start_codon:yes stop_codon:yes gene_type:complete
MTDLAVVNPEELSKLASILGATQERSAGNSRLPELKINAQADDDDGNPLPRPSFYLKGQAQTVYADTVQFRPLSHHYQWLHYDPEANKLVNKTRMVKNFREEARDIKGGVKCGKPPYKVMQELPDEERERFREITLFRQVRGLVSYTGKTVAGEEVVIENVPCILMLKGSNYSAFESDYMDKLPSGAAIYDYEITLSAKRNKNGSVTWFTFVYGETTKVPMSKDAYDTMLVIAEMITKENKQVDDAYFDAIRSDSIDDGAIDALGDALDADFEDVA